MLAALLVLLLLISSVDAFFQSFGKVTGAPLKRASPETLLDAISRLSRGKENGLRVSPADRAKILDCVAQLEAQNPSRVIGR